MIYKQSTIRTKIVYLTTYYIIAQNARANDVFTTNCIFAFEASQITYEYFLIFQVLIFPIS